MTPKEHAEVWRRAAKVVGEMDRSRSLPMHLAVGQNTWLSEPFSNEQGIAWEAYRQASKVLSAIADEYEKAS
jgi:hypothetical protein